MGRGSGIFAGAGVLVAMSCVVYAGAGSAYSAAGDIAAADARAGAVEVAAAHTGWNGGVSAVARGVAGAVAAAEDTAADEVFVAVAPQGSAIGPQVAGSPVVGSPAEGSLSPQQDGVAVASPPASPASAVIAAPSYPVWEDMAPGIPEYVGEDTAVPGDDASAEDTSDDDGSGAGAVEGGVPSLPPVGPADDPGAVPAPVVGFVPVAGMPPSGSTPPVVLGLTVGDASALAEAAGYQVRVVFEDGVRKTQSMEYFMNRINVEVVEGVVVEVESIG